VLAALRRKTEVTGVLTRAPLVQANRRLEHLDVRKAIVVTAPPFPMPDWKSLERKELLTGCLLSQIVEPISPESSNGAAFRPFCQTNLDSLV